MDKFILTSILECLLLRPGFPSSIISQMITIPQVTFDRDNLRLRIGLTLRSINSQATDGYITENLLTSLETLEKMLREHNMPILDSMKSAYSAVVLGCLWGNLRGDGNHVKFSQAVERILDVRVSKLENSELVTDELRSHRESIKALRLNTDDLKNWKESNKKRKDNAMALTRSFVSECMDLMGPSLLERVLMAELEKTVSRGEAVEKGSRDQSTEIDIEFFEGEEMKIRDEMQLVEEEAMTENVESDPKGMQADMDMEGCRPGGAEAVDVASTSDPKGEEIEREVFPTQKRCKQVLSIESDDLMDSVFDELDTVPISEMMRAQKNEKLPDESPVKITERRAVQKWTDEEEIALKKGMEMYGKGNWKQIWIANQEILGKRTPIDLKDKCRNMEMSEKRKRKCP